MLLREKLRRLLIKSTTENVHSNIIWCETQWIQILTKIAKKNLKDWSVRGERLKNVSSISNSINAWMPEITKAQCYPDWKVTLLRQMY